MLHLYIRASRDSKAYENEWVGDFKVNSIATYAEVAEHCRRAQESGQPIRIHRRKYERVPATICCECYVKSIIPEGNGFRVYFESWRPLYIERDKVLQKGYYFADPQEYEVERTSASDD